MYVLHTWIRQTMSRDDFIMRAYANILILHDLLCNARIGGMGEIHIRQIIQLYGTLHFLTGKTGKST